MLRVDVESALAEEDAVLRSIVRLVRCRVRLSEWPVEARRALLVALSEVGLGDIEAAKARALGRHLFGAGETRLPLDVPALADAQTQRNAERVRADLAAKVPLRSGRAFEC